MRYEFCCPNSNNAKIVSKISVANVRQNIKDLLAYSTDEKKRNFTETIELQIGLKNYDPQRYSSVIPITARSILLTNGVVTSVSPVKSNCPLSLVLK